MANSRKARGAETQRIVTEYLKEHGWPWATDAGAGRSGSDILNTPGLGFEVKARRDLSLPSWLRQADNGSGVPIVVHRPDGFGPATIRLWPMTMRFVDGVELLRKAGYATDVEMIEAEIVEGLEG